MKQLEFNDKQWEALTLREGAALVLAGAGSGKTRVVTSRIAYLIQQGIPSSQILAVTFTNKAAQEMKERVQKLCHEEVLICTFHSLGVRVLRECCALLGYSPYFTIYDEEDILKVLKSCFEELELGDKKGDLKVMRQAISQAKNNLLDPLPQEEGDGDSFTKLYALYQKKMQEYQAVDFDDLLFLTVKLWKEYPEVLASYQAKWPFILIDEYQDTNSAQYLMTALLASKYGNLFVVGDPDQSIYSWRGANIRNILNFEKDYPGAKIIRLEQNYRSHMRILKAANALISHNEGRYEKELWSQLGEGESLKLFVAMSEKAEARFIARTIAFHRQKGALFSDMAVFYRTNAQSRAFEDVLISAKIPYKIVGGLSFYQRKEIKDLLSFLRLAFSPSDFVSFERTLQIPKRGIGATTVDKLREQASLEKRAIIDYIAWLVAGKPLQFPLKISSKQKEALKDYVEMILFFREMSQKASPSEIVKKVIEKSGYLSYLKLEPDTFEERSENVNELIAKAIEWEESSEDPSLASFLEELSLKSNLESESEEEHLSLMTIHHGKGLEFPLVFLAGLEEDLFPHINAKQSGEQLEEERRLCYVGITRAKEHLYLSYCKERFLWGSFRSQRPSRFLKELPRELIERIEEAPASLPAVSSDLSQEEEKPAQGELAVGGRIFHAEFGLGQIQDISHGSMGPIYKIWFDKDRSLKSIVAKYASLIAL